MSDIAIRSATHADVSIIAKYNDALAYESEGRRLDPAITVPAVEAVLDDDSKGFYLVAESAGEPIGQLMVTYEWSDWRGGMMWWVQSVYVREDFRRRGVYKSLYRHLREMAGNDEGVMGIRLYVETENVRAQKAYAALGMKKASYFVFEEDFVFTDHRPGEGKTEE